jgi:hypothetical protein
MRIRTTVMMDRELYKQWKILAVTEDKSVAELTEEAMREYLCS